MVASPLTGPIVLLLLAIFIRRGDGKPVFSLVSVAATFAWAYTAVHPITSSPLDVERGVLAVAAGLLGVDLYQTFTTSKQLGDSWRSMTRPRQLANASALLAGMLLVFLMLHRT